MNKKECKKYIEEMEKKIRELAEKGKRVKLEVIHRGYEITNSESKEFTEEVKMSGYLWLFEDKPILLSRRNSRKYVTIYFDKSKFDKGHDVSIFVKKIIKIIK